MSYDDDHPEVYPVIQDDQLLTIELTRYQILTIDSKHEDKDKNKEDA